MLKVFDAEAQSCIVFSDFGALCKLMTAGGAMATALGQVCEDEEVKVVMRSKLISAVQDLLQSALGKNANKFRPSTVLTDQVSKCMEACSLPDFLAKGCKFSLELVLACVDSRSTDVLQLSKAIETLADLKRDLGPWADALAHFLITTGQVIFEDAASVLQKRQGELENQAKTDEMRQMVEVLIKPSTGFAQVLSQMNDFFSESCKLSKRKKGQNPLSAQQLAALAEHEKTIVQALHSRAREQIAANVGLALIKCAAAVEKGGYILADIDGGTYEKAMPLDELKELLTNHMAHDAFKHHAHEDLSVLCEMCSFVFEVMQYVVTRTTAFRAFGHVGSVLKSDAGRIKGVSSWMLKLGLPQESVEKLWEGIIVQAYEASRGKKAAEASVLWKQMLNEILQDKFAGIDLKSTRGLLNLLEQDSVEHDLLTSFFNIIQDYTKMLMAGSLASPKLVNSLSAAARTLSETWPSGPQEEDSVEQDSVETASGQGELWQACSAEHE